MVNEATGYYRRYNKWAIFALNLMGDPEMPIWTARPATLDVSHKTVLDKRDPFVVIVTRPFVSMSFPLSGAAVHIQQGSFSRLAISNSAGRTTFNLNPGDLGPLTITVTKTGYLPNLGEARIGGPAWVKGRVTQIVHEDGSPQRSHVRLFLDRPIDGDEHRGWYARKSLPDYAIIMDAVTDAYVGGKKISLFVDNIDEGGLIERFAFGQRIDVLRPRLPFPEANVPEMVTPEMKEVERTGDISEVPETPAASDQESGQESDTVIV